MVLFFCCPLTVIAKSKPGGAPPAPKAEKFSEMFTKGNVFGEFRTFYFSQDYDRDDLKDKKTFATGGMLHARTAPFKGISFGAGFYTAQPLGLNDDDDEVYGGLVPKDSSGNADNVTVLGEYFIAYDISKTKIKVGAQELKTMWLTHWDKRLIPVTHEGLSILSKEIENLEIEAGHMLRFKDTAADDFVWISDSYKGVPDDQNSGCSYLQFKYAGFKGWRLIGAYHLFHDIFSNTWLSADYRHKVSKDLTLWGRGRTVFQSDAGDALGTGGQGFDTHMIGGQVGTAYKGLKLLVNYSTIGDHDLMGARTAVKNIALQKVNNVRAEEVAWSFRAEQDLSRFFDRLKGLRLIAEYGIFDTPDKGQKNAAEDMTELDLELNYAMQGCLDGWTLRIRHAIVDGDWANSQNDYSDTRSQLTYTF